MSHPENPRAGLMSRALLFLFVASFGAMASFYLLLSVVPRYAMSVGGGEVGAGLATGALMLSTVATELFTPRLVSAFGHRRVFAAGLFLLGVPALALPAATTLAAILAVCIIRGAGVAITVVVGGSLVASLLPDERRGEGLGLYGIVVSIPAVIGLPLGLWFSAHAGYPAVFIAGAAAALAGVAAVGGLPARAPQTDPSLSLFAAIRTPSLTRPSLVFAATTMAAGIIFTFLPLAVTHASGNLASLALLVQAATSTLTRWWAGRHGDAHGAARLLMPALLLVALGMFTLLRIDSTAAVIIGMLLFGAGFGIAQNVSLAMMFERVSPTGYDAVSALWNIAYDAGLGVGAVGFGLAVSRAGYPLAFAFGGVLVLLAMVPAWLDRRAELVVRSAVSRSR